MPPAITKLLRRIYLALVAPVIIIDLGIITMGAGDGLALAGAAFQTALLSFTAIAILIACPAHRTRVAGHDSGRGLRLSADR